MRKRPHHGIRTRRAHWCINRCRTSPTRWLLSLRTIRWPDPPWTSPIGTPARRCNRRRSSSHHKSMGLQLLTLIKQEFLSFEVFRNPNKFASSCPKSSSSASRIFSCKSLGIAEYSREKNSICDWSARCRKDRAMRIDEFLLFYLQKVQ